MRVGFRVCTLEFVSGGTSTVCGVSPASAREFPSPPPFSDGEKFDVGRQLSFDELDTPLSETTFVVVDLETTGGSADQDSITEIGAVRSAAARYWAKWQHSSTPAGRFRRT